jgi:peptidoglycan/LPS O-acetylase OafA/YrhL
VAVLSVLVYHAFPGLLPGGFAGVDVFFVISGYLISTIILDGLTSGRFSFADFYARRIRRIFPALLLVLGCTAIIGWYRLTPDEYAALGKHVLAGAAFVSNFILWHEAGYFDAESAGKPLLHLWSLAIEEQFYLVWPLLLFALYHWRHQAVIWVTALLLLASMALNLVLLSGNPTAAFYNTAARMWELLIGALLAVWHLRKSTCTHTCWQAASWQVVLSIAGLALLVMAFSVLNPQRLFPGLWALLPTMGAALLIAAGPHTWINRHLLASRPMVWIGLISYPLYLWHWPLLSVAHLQSGGDADWTLRLGLVGLSLVLAALTYVLLERPLRYGRMNRRLLVTVLCGTMGGMAAAGVTSLRQEGFEQRFPPEVGQLTKGGGTRMVTQGWRNTDCMLGFRVPPSEFKDFCIEDRRPLVFLWGDSHANSLYPGFKALQDSGLHDFGIGERGGAICPPILGIEPRPSCRDINDDTIQAIREHRPDVVVLYAWWHHRAYDLGPLETTVAELRSAGVPRIILLGAVPYWQGPLPRVLFDAWREGPVSRLPPLRLKKQLDPQLDAITREMRERSEAMGIEFISGLDAFCNEDGCLTRLSEEAVEPLSYDYGHLAPAAVTYYVQWLAPKIFGPPPAR